MSGQRPTFRQIKASFEARSKPTTSTSAPSTPTLELADRMFPTKGFKPVDASIDSILDTAKSTVPSPSSTSSPAAATSSTAPRSGTSAPTTSDPPASSAPTPSNQPASAPTSPILGAIQRPSLRLTASSRPFWIGPPRSATPAFQAMRQPVTIEYASAGLQPPVYVFTSLSDPPWSPVEMECSKKDNGDFDFHKSFAADEGEYQYKFRLGPGDWWALDDSKPTVDDGQGNKNNLMVVKPPAPKPQSQSQSQQAATTTPTPEQPRSADAASAPVTAVDKVNQEALAERPNAVSTPTAVADPKPEPFATPHPGPMLKHESFFPEAAPGAQADADDNDEATLVEEEDDDDYFDHPSPLLRHETLGRDAEEQHQAPLMRHESKGIGEHDDDFGIYLHDSHRRQSIDSDPSDAISPEADPNDPSLEPFPTDPAAIHEHIHRISTSIPADQTSDDINTDSPLSLVRSTNSLSPVRSLASVREEEDEDEDQELASLRETERQQARRELETREDMDPGTEIPVVKVIEPDGGFAALITPPMTPQEAETVLETVKSERLAEGSAEKVIEQQQQEGQREEGGEKKAEKGEEVVVEIVQARGLAGVMADMVAHPFSWFAIAGVAIALVVGTWKARYA